MKKSTLRITLRYDFDLIGLVAPVKDYKMAWLINNSLGVRLVKVEDFRIEFLDQSDLVVSQYLLEKEHGYIQLLKNRAYSADGFAGYLLPELKIMDYFLLLEDHAFETDINSYIEALSDNKLIQNVVKLNVLKLKSKENLLSY